jgi:hypothetical protein
MCRGSFAGRPVPASPSGVDRTRSCLRDCGSAAMNRRISIAKSEGWRRRTPRRVDAFRFGPLDPAIIDRVRECRPFAHAGRLDSFRARRLSTPCTTGALVPRRTDEMDRGSISPDPARALE